MSIEKGEWNMDQEQLMSPRLWVRSSLCWAPFSLATTLKANAGIAPDKRKIEET